MNEGPVGRSVGRRLLGPGIVLALLVLFWAVNRDDVNVSFVVFEATVPLWLALAVSAALGAVGGWLVRRSRRRD